MKIPAFVGGSYTARSNAIADEECINLFAETIESEGAQTKRSYIGTPGLAVFATLPESPTRGSWEINGRAFAVGGSAFVELFSDGTQITRATIANDGTAVSIAASSIQLLIISAGSAYCYTLATDAIVNVTSSLAGVPVKAEFSDGYFAVCFSDSNKFQTSDILDGATWPGLQVNEVSVFPENIRSIIVNHRELWVMGGRHLQPYQDTGSDEIFDPIGGALIEQGCAATFGCNRADNTIFWISEDERGARVAWRANGYTPQRISTHAVENDLSSYASISGLTSYTYQDEGHLFWVLYIPGSQWSWVFDVAENLWHKRASWDANTATWGPHWSWNHIYAFGKHLVGDWNTGNVYEMHLATNDGSGVYTFVEDNGTEIRRLRRSPTIVNEMEWVQIPCLTLDFQTGLGPQPPLQDGNGDDRQPQVMLRWSDDRGQTWSNEHILDCGFAGEFNKRVIIWRLGRTRYRVWEISMTDPIPWYLVDAYMTTA